PPVPTMVTFTLDSGIRGAPQVGAGFDGVTVGPPLRGGQTDGLGGGASPWGLCFPHGTAQHWWNREHDLFLVSYPCGGRRPQGLRAIDRGIRTRLGSGTAGRHGGSLHRGRKLCRIAVRRPGAWATGDRGVLG